MSDPFTFTKRRGVWSHSIGCDWAMRERGSDCECGLAEAWAAEEASTRAIWVDGPDSEAARAAKANPRATWARLDALAEQVSECTTPLCSVSPSAHARTGSCPRPFSERVAEADAEVSTWTDAKRQAADRVYLGANTGAREPDYRAMWEEACRERDEARAYHRKWRDELARWNRAHEDMQVEAPPDPTHTPAVRRVVAWKTYRGDFYDQEGDAYWHAAMELIASAYRRCPSRLRGETVDCWWNQHWRRPRVNAVAAYLRHRDESRGHR